MRKFISIAFLLITLGCNPDGAGCFESSGPLETVEIEVPQFTEIDISGNIEVRINPKVANKVLVSAGSNLLPGIRTEVIDGVLYLDNLNTCDFVRSFVNPVVMISNPDLKTVIQHGYGKVISTDTLIYDELKLIGEDGSGDFEVLVNIPDLLIGSNNIGNFYVSGTAAKLRISSSWNDAIFFCQELQVVNCYVNQSGSNSMHLNVSGQITGSINSIGNIILHKQMPALVDVTETSRGKLLYDFE